jgi:hypothetical protein
VILRVAGYVAIVVDKGNVCGDGDARILEGPCGRGFP